MWDLTWKWFYPLQIFPTNWSVIQSSRDSILCNRNSRIIVKISAKLFSEISQFHDELRNYAIDTDLLDTTHARNPRKVFYTVSPRPVLWIVFRCFDLWRCLVRVLPSFGLKHGTISWYLSQINLFIFSLQGAPEVLFHHSTCRRVTYSFSHALGMLYFGVRPRIIYGCINRWTL